MLNDPLSNALSKVMNAERRAQKSCIIRPVSGTIKEVFRIMNENGYLGDYAETMVEGKGSLITLNLLGGINKCNAIKPRYAVKISTYEKFEKRFLPAKDFGIIIVSTPQGMMSHVQAKEKHIGGKLVAYCY